MFKSLSLKVIIFGFIFTFFSSFGQSFFIGLFNPSVRDTLNIVERAYIIHNGEILKSGSPKEIAQDSNVKQVYLGSKFRF